MRIFLTGATGFIGYHLVPLMKHHQLLLVGQHEENFSGAANLKFIKNDLKNFDRWKEEVEEFSPEACIHLAWSGLPDYSLSRCTENFDISIQLLGFLTHIGCKRIFVAGTCWEYGGIQGQASENAQPEAPSLFASFKTAIRLIGKQLTRSKDINFIWGRIFFVYGPGQRSTSLIPSCYQSLKNGKAPELRNPNAVNDFIHVSDVAKAILRLIETPSVEGVFNIGSGKPKSVVDICRSIAKTLDLENLLPEPINCPQDNGLWADTSLINKTIGWHPEFSIETGISETIRSLELKS